MHIIRFKYKISLILFIFVLLSFTVAFGGSAVIEDGCPEKETEFARDLSGEDIPEPYEDPEDGQAPEETFDPAEALPAGATEDPPVLKIIDVPLIRQGEKYPNGCESISTVMLLRYFKNYITPEEFINGFLDKGAPPFKYDYGPDPDLVYCGDPYSISGWGCNSPVIYKALKRILDPKKYSVVQSRETSLEELCEKYVDNDLPVLIWATIEMKEGYPLASWYTYEGKLVVYNRGLHCLLLVGYDENSYYFNDPLSKEENGNTFVSYPKEQVEKCFASLGNQSVAVVPKNAGKG